MRMRVAFDAAHDLLFGLETVVAGSVDWIIAMLGMTAPDFAAVAQKDSAAVRSFVVAVAAGKLAASIVLLDLGTKMNGKDWRVRLVELRTFHTAFAEFELVQLGAVAAKARQRLGHRMGWLMKLLQAQSAFCRM